MKVLQLCPKPPLPAIDGGCMASHSLAQNLIAAGADLSILCMATDKHPFTAQAFTGEFNIPGQVEAITINTKLSAGILLSYMFTGNSNYKLRFFLDSFSNALRLHLAENTYDYIVFDGFKTAYYIPVCRKLSKAKMIYRAHNIEHAIVREQAVSDAGIIKGMLLRKDSVRLEKEEKSVWNDSDQIWCISDADRKIISSNAPDHKSIITIPYTYSNEVAGIENIPHTVFHLGAMDWKPNIEGMQWFMREVWPLVLLENKAAKLHIGGKGIEKFMKSNERLNVTVHRNVVDSSRFFASYQIMVIPLKKGGGVRVKLIQALSMGKAVVTTSKGCEGVNGRNGIHYLIADDAAHMAREIGRLLNDDTLRRELAESSIGFYKENYHPAVATALLKNNLNKTTGIEQ